MLLRLVDLADAVQLQRPIQMYIGQVGLADRRNRTVRIIEPAAQLVGRGEVWLGQFVQPQQVVVVADADVGIAAQRRIGDPGSEGGLRGDEVTQYRVDGREVQTFVAVHLDSVVL